MIPLIKSSFLKEKATKKALARFILQADRLSMGEECQKFEEAFAFKQQRKHAVFVSNGSMANLILIQALLNLGRLKKGDHVGVSALTWATNVMPLFQLGLVPMILDCEKETLNVSLDELKKKSKGLKAFFITNALGFCHDLYAIEMFCKKNHILLLEDNCESLGSIHHGKLLGNFGIASTFSFFVGHHMSTIEGGMICTDDAALHDMLVMVRAHGWDRNLAPKTQHSLRTCHRVNSFLAKYTFYDLAYNGRPTEIHGFLGNTQLQYWDLLVQKREKNFYLFHSWIQKNKDFIPLNVSHMNLVSNFAMPLICKTQTLFKYYIKRFEKAGVEIRPIISGDMNDQPFYKKYTSPTLCPKAQFIQKNGFYFANNPEMTNVELKTLVRLLKNPHE